MFAESMGTSMGKDRKTMKTPIYLEVSSSENSDNPGFAGGF
jgi:hypothetical protein